MLARVKRIDTVLRLEFGRAIEDLWNYGRILEFSIRVDQVAVVEIGFRNIAIRSRVHQVLVFIVGQEIRRIILPNCGHYLRLERIQVLSLIVSKEFKGSCRRIYAEELLKLHEKGVLKLNQPCNWQINVEFAWEINIIEKNALKKSNRL